MSQIDLQNLGSTGLVLDNPPYSIPLTGLSNCRNVRFAGGQIKNFPGHLPILDPSISIETPYYIQAFAVPDTNTFYWILFGHDDSDPVQTEFGMTDGGTKQDVTPVATYPVTSNDQWTGGIFGGIPVVTNGRQNVPLYLNDISGTPRFEVMPYKITPGDPPVIESTWATEGVSANCIRTFKNLILALDVTKGNERFPYLLKWSDAADPGLIPAWDETDPSLLANEIPLQQQGGYLVDFLPLRDTGMIYREESIWSLSLVGGEFIFNVREAINSIGLLAQNCAVYFQGQHLVLGQGDIVVHNGSSPQSIVQDRIKRYIFRTMDTDYYASSFVARNDPASEVWVCYPTEGSPLPDIAAVWNWRDNTWTLRDLPARTSFMIGATDISSQTLPTAEPWGCLSLETGDDPCDPNAPETQVTPVQWGGQLDPGDPNYGSYPGGFVPYVPKTWTERDFNAAIRTFIGVGESGVYKMDSGILYDGEVPTCMAERIDLPLGGNDRRVKVRRVYPQMTGSGSVEIYIGSQPAPSAPVSWEGPRSFLPGRDSFINVRRSGKSVAWRIQSRSSVEWTMYGMRWDYTEEGRQ